MTPKFIKVIELLKDGTRRELYLNTNYIVTVKRENNKQADHNTTIYTTNVSFPLFILERFEEVMSKING